MSGRKSTIAHPDELDIGQDHSIELDSDLTIEQIRDRLNSSTIDVVSAVGFKSHAENLAFMEEIVAVCVFPTQDKNAEQIVEVFNDGTAQRFIRGQWQTVKRKYVEVLARAKQFSVQTPETMDRDGNRTTRIDTSHGLRYPFEMKDKNPRGSAWLSSILQEA